MRLLLCHNFYREDSGENVAFRLLGEILRAHGDEVLEYTRHNSELDGLTPAERMRIFAYGFHSPRTVREIATLIGQTRPDVALVQNVFPLISPSAYPALRRARVPVAQLVYNYRFVCPDAHLFTEGAVCERCVRGSTANAVIHKCYRDSRLFSAWYAAIVGWHRQRGTFAGIDRFLVPDDFMRRKLAEGGLPAARMAVVGNPFQIANYWPSSAEDDFILFVGRLIPQKGILTLIRAFAASGDASHNVGGGASRRIVGGDSSPRLLVVIGDGESRAEAERLARELAPGRVRFAGEVWGEALRDYLARCAFVCIPSEWYDNAPLILYQAYATGKPVIAARIDGLPEVVADGEDGLLATPGDMADWAEKVNRLTTDMELRRRLGTNARRKAEADFTAPAYYRRLHDILGKLVEEAL